MMACHSEVEDQFFDTRDEITSVSDLGSDGSEDFCSSIGFVEYGCDHFGYATWTKSPESAHQRRSRFLKWMGLVSDQNKTEGEEEVASVPSDEMKIGIDRITEDSGAVLGNSYLEDRILFSWPSVHSLKDAEFRGEDASQENFVCRIKNLNDGTEFVLDDSPNGIFGRLRQVGSNRLITLEEFQKTFGSSSFVQQLFRREAEACNSVYLKKRVRKGWLQKLSGRSCIAYSTRESRSESRGFSSEVRTGIGRVQVHSYKKNFKELSSLCKGQEFPAHEGSILTMKFSHDGRYLATAGEDGAVRIWKVIEDERPNNFGVQHADPSCLYLSVNHLAKLDSLDANKGKNDKMIRMKKSPDSACVILPPKVFRLMEEPLHEFRGHSGEILALSWSKKGYLLSSSVDETARLWKVGQNQCVGFFYHNNYVTSVEFNPNDDNYFISGSIDGKVRIWEVRGCQVVDWIDIKEIVTAVCYYPNGKGAIVGLMDGSCCFYDIVDNHLQLGTQVFFKGKKKLPCKRITGFQFSPSDPSKVLVTSADSQIRLLCGCNVIFKLKGVKSMGSQIIASFTSDGKHIISASEDSRVYVWNYVDQETPLKAKKISSSESFWSPNASIAITWSGMKPISRSLPTLFVRDNLADYISQNGHLVEDIFQNTASSSPDCFSLSRAFLLDSLLKGSATWPEENLPNASPKPASPTISRFEYKFFKSACQNTSASHMWGLAIVTAGWDGQIRTYYNYGLPIRL